MLTHSQAKLLNWIIVYQREHRSVSPTFEEMAKGIGLKSKSGAHRIIDGLEQRGFIRRLPGKARAIEVVRKPEEILP